MAGVAGFEPTAHGFGDHCSTTELHTYMVENLSLVVPREPYPSQTSNPDKERTNRKDLSICSYNLTFGAPSRM